MTDTLTKGKVFKDDLSLHSGGATTTGVRKTSTGGTQTLEQFDWIGVDVYSVYGARTSTAIQAALDAIGTTRYRQIWLSPGNWVLSANITVQDNVRLCLADGAQITGAYTLTINGQFLAGKDPFGGTLTVVWGSLSSGMYSDGGGNLIMVSTRQDTPKINEDVELGATSTEIDRVCDGATVTVAELNLLSDFIIKRSIFVYNGSATAYTVKVGAGYYFVKDKVAKWTSQLTTGAISTPAANTRYYLYLDYSAITSATAITATELIWSATAPSYSHTYNGWYNGDDLCIFGVITNTGPDNILEFFHDGGDYIRWAEAITEASAITPTNSWTDVDCSSSLPAFCTRALATFATGHVDATSSAWVRVNGQTGSTGSRVGTVSASAVYDTGSTIIYTDTSQTIEVKWLDVTTNIVNVYTEGWFLPAGM